LLGEPLLRIAPLGEALLREPGTACRAANEEPLAPGVREPSAAPTCERSKPEGDDGERPPSEGARLPNDGEEPSAGRLRLGAGERSDGADGVAERALKLRCGEEKLGAWKLGAERLGAEKLRCEPPGTAERSAEPKFPEDDPGLKLREAPPPKLRLPPPPKLEMPPPLNARLEPPPKLWPPPGPRANAAGPSAKLIVASHAAKNPIRDITHLPG
jgi:hypothetical protein